jgi:hypothetical protein
VWENFGGGFIIGWNGLMRPYDLDLSHSLPDFVSSKPSVRIFSRSPFRTM